MQAVVLSQNDLDVIQKSLIEIRTHLKDVVSPSEHFIDNNAFLKLMGVSSRTAQIWRDEGIIGFSQIGKKIYYRMSDIDVFLSGYHREPIVKPEFQI
ncbi:MAG: helix-turn-helix domain-containing protein [Saprospiraceae bacterium]